MPDPAKPHTFQLGLVMAGAVSAGAYTAGVLDFLLEALDEWYRLRETDDSLPRHDVEITVVSGASAGAMTAALLAAALGERFPPARPEADAETLAQNRLYRSWVQSIDIMHLLGTRDLDGRNGAVRSLLDSTVLDEIADQAIAFDPAHATERPYVAARLHVFLTLANLVGIPYRIAFEGAVQAGHPMTTHADHVRFVRSVDPAQGEQSAWLSARDPTHNNWKRLREAALASGAFPVGLKPRRLTLLPAGYGERSWRIPQPLPEPPIPDDHRCYREAAIAPAWPDGFDPTADQPFLCVDGGVMDNEPLELARQTLAGPLGSNPRDPERASRAVILIDPFPTVAWPRRLPSDFDVLDVLPALVGSLLEQARFKPGELALAQDEAIYSRYLIAPSRREKDDSRARYPIASGLLGGFSGFLSRRFRNHDFHLGRRNCQKFLMSHLAIPAETAGRNPVLGANSRDTLWRASFAEDGESYVPLIPLVGTAAEEVEAIPWETLALGPKELKAIERALKRRTTAVVRRLIDARVDGFVGRWAGRAIARWKRGAIADRVLRSVKGELAEPGLLRRG